ncbi:hypothetical protein GIB67_029515 [Kingdonia uniflora]|uniref:Poly [ADP-ribose] polymerase n=1 Tax=Kingdonia uniflora TaxID=39325 RepID=A0A7J7NY45_9MAGN|nr:hypothetical protein GIB67_029515 [Kingdonia uniflora]
MKKELQEEYLIAQETMMPKLDQRAWELPKSAKRKYNKNKIAQTVKGDHPPLTSWPLRESLGNVETPESINFIIDDDLISFIHAKCLISERQSLLAFILNSDFGVRAKVKLYGKCGVYKDTMLQEKGGKIFEKDGILYNCAFSVCDQGRGVNNYAITQLVTVPEESLHLYFKKGKVGDDPRAEERLEEWEDVDGVVKKFIRLFEELTGNKFEPWEKEKKFLKKPRKFYPIDMDDGVDVRHGSLGHRQLGVAATHCQLESLVANFMKVLCSQEIYRYALMEMGYDSPDLPMGMLSNLSSKKIYEKLGCPVSPLEKEPEDYKMILKYLEKTYKPIKVEDISYGVTVENIFAVEPSACPSLDDMKKLLNQFGKAVVCTDAAAEAAVYGFTAVDRPDRFLVLAIASLGDTITEVTSPPEDTKSLEEKKVDVKGLGRKRTDESEHFMWKDDIKVPCGRLIASEHKESPLEYNEYAVYDPKQVFINKHFCVNLDGLC